MKADKKFLEKIKSLQIQTGKAKPKGTVYGVKAALLVIPVRRPAKKRDQEEKAFAA